MSEPTRNDLPIPVVLSTNKCTRSGLPIPVTITGGTGVVNSVNGQTGDAVLDGNNIYADASEATPVTLNDALAGEAQDRQDEDSNLQTKINALAGLGGALPHKDFGASPTAGQPLPEAWQETLTEYACESIWGDGGVFTWNSAEPWNSIYVIDEVTHTAVEIFNSTWVRNDNDNHKFVLTNTPNTSPQIFDWADVGIDAVAQFTDTLAGVIKGDNTTFGAIKSNTDGTGSVNGITNTGNGTKALLDNGSYGVPPILSKWVTFSSGTFEANLKAQMPQLMFGAIVQSVVGNLPAGVSGTCVATYIMTNPGTGSVGVAGCGTLQDINGNSWNYRVTGLDTDTPVISWVQTYPQSWGIMSWTPSATQTSTASGTSVPMVGTAASSDFADISASGYITFKKAGRYMFYFGRMDLIPTSDSLWSPGITSLTGGAWASTFSGTPRLKYSEWGLGSLNNPILIRSPAGGSARIMWSWCDAIMSWTFANIAPCQLILTGNY